MALKLYLTEPGEWTIKRDRVEIGRLQCTRQGVKFSLIDRKHPLSPEEKKELDNLVRQKDEAK